jgi:mannosyltransferase
VGHSLGRIDEVLPPPALRASGLAASRHVAHGPLLAGVLALTAFLAAFGLGRDSFWLDEAFSVRTAESSWSELWDVVFRHEANMVLYYVVLHVWLVLGDGEIAVRALSVGFAVLAVAALYALGARLFGRTHGLVAAVLLGVNPFFLEYARAGRGYTLVVLMVTLSTSLFVTAVERPSRGRWSAYAAVSALALYAHFFAALVLLAQAAALLWVGQREARRRGLAALGAATILGSPLLLFVVTRDSGQIDWLRAPSPLDLFVVVLDFAGRSLFLALIFLLLAAFVISLALRRRGRGERWRLVLVACWLVVPITVSFGVSYLKPVFFSRYLVVCLPALALCASVGLLAERRRLVSALAVTAVVLLSLAQVRALYRDGGANSEDWRGAAEHVLAHARQGDGIVFFRPYVSIGFDHYAARAPARAVRPQPLFAYRGYAFTGRMVPSSWEHLRNVTSSRIWLVLSHNRRQQTETQHVRALLGTRYGLVQHCRFKKVVVELYARPGAAGRRSGTCRARAIQGQSLGPVPSGTA